MGKAAWMSCRFLSGKWNDEAGEQFENDLGNMHLMTLKGKETKWTTTYLIIGQNLRLRERAEAISSHLKEFLGDLA